MSSGVRKDFQQALAELRTDLDDFTESESFALMACGYEMATRSFQRDLSGLRELWEDPREGNWVFQRMLDKITSTAAGSRDRDNLLQELKAGRKIRI